MSTPELGGNRNPPPPNKFQMTQRGQSPVLSSDSFKAQRPRISLTHYVICCRRSLTPSIYYALMSEFLLRTGVQFILGKPNIVLSDVLQLPEYEATLELGLTGAYLDVIPCRWNTRALCRFWLRARRSFPPF
jgi:hypothetical protein